MTPLALACYAALQPLVPSRSDARLSYSDLLALLPDDFLYLDLGNPQHRNELSAALGEVVVRCRAADLPALPALVVLRDGDQLGYPGEGYYPTAHPGVDDPLRQQVAWGWEVEAVQRTNYPPTL